MISQCGIIKKKERGKDKLLLIVLYEQQFFEDIINLFVESGIRGATVLESSGIKNQMMSIPLFSSFLNFLGEQSDTSKTIMAIIPEAQINSLISGIEELMGDLDNHTGIMITCMDVDFVKGSLEI